MQGSMVLMIRITITFSNGGLQKLTCSCLAVLLYSGVEWDINFRKKTQERVKIQVYFT